MTKTKITSFALGWYWAVELGGHEYLEVVEVIDGSNGPCVSAKDGDSPLENYHLLSRIPEPWGAND